MARSLDSDTKFTSVKETLLYTDTIVIRVKGQGKKLMDYPDITFFNLDPALLVAMNIREVEGGVLEVPVILKPSGSMELIKSVLAFLLPFSTIITVMAAGIVDRASNAASLSASATFLFERVLSRVNIAITISFLLFFVKKGVKP